MLNFVIIWNCASSKISKSKPLTLISILTIPVNILINLSVLYLNGIWSFFFKKITSDFFQFLFFSLVPLLSPSLIYVTFLSRPYDTLLKSFTFKQLNFHSSPIPALLIFSLNRAPTSKAKWRCTDINFLSFSLWHLRAYYMQPSFPVSIMCHRICDPLHMQYSPASFGVLV